MPHIKNLLRLQLQHSRFSFLLFCGSIRQIPVFLRFAEKHGTILYKSTYIGRKDGGMPMTGKQDKVYLLPQTIGYYQLELTRLLEFERYGEAMELLRFLLDCDIGDKRTREEWQSLLDWMLTMIPEPLTTAVKEEAELTEEELFLQHLNEKAERDPQYTEKLLDVFRRPDSWDKQVLALEQLRYLHHPKIRDVLLQWLESRPLPPILQFRAMQILKLRGEKGSVKLRRNGKIYTADIADVPTSREEHPRPLQEIIQLVLNSGKRDEIPLEEFAGETWGEFVAYAFGTPLYAELLAETEKNRTAWAAAFHYMLLLTAHGTASTEEIKQVYGISGALEQKWEKAVRVFAEFSRTVFPSLS